MAAPIPDNIRREFVYTRSRFEELYAKISRVELPVQNEVFEAHRHEWNALVKKLVWFFEIYGLE